MAAFVDPRTHPVPNGPRGCATTTDAAVLGALHRLCHHNRLYDVERWIKDGRPLQTSSKRQQTTALRIAIEHRNHAFVLLLLCNGYDSDLDTRCPLTLAIGSGRMDLVDLLLEAGATPRRVLPQTILETYDSALFERFESLGVDLTEGHALARALADHTTNKPLFGYARTRRDRDPRMQKELNIALIEHARKRNEGGVKLCLWAGADPHALSIDLHDPDPREYDHDGQSVTTYLGTTPIAEACAEGDQRVLALLKPDPARDDFDELYGLAGSVDVVDYLATLALPQDGGAIVRSHLSRCTFDWSRADVLRRLFKLGIRWTASTAGEVAETRRDLLSLRDESFVAAMKVLVQNDHCAEDILKRLARTPSMRARIAKVGIGRLSSRASEGATPGGRSPRAKLGIPIVKRPAYVPRLVEIGRRRPAARELHLDRVTLFERVWTEPIERIAKRWGLSGRGLAKACARVHVPTPSRDFWSRVRAGQRVRRPALPRLRAGQAEVIVVYEFG